MKKRKNIFVFFSAFLFSAFGYEFIFFIMTLHIYELSKSAINVGIFTTLTFIPRLFSSIMGGIADKFRKGRCFTFSAVMTCILLLIMSGIADIKWIYLIWFTVSIFLTFIVNVRGSLLAEVISHEQYANGNAWMLCFLNGAKLLGPLIGGCIIMLTNIRPLIYFTCFIYLMAALSSIFISVSNKAIILKVSFLENVKKGFRFMVENRVFGLLTAISFFWRLFLGLQLSLFVIYIKSYLSGNSEQYGFFITTMGVGSIVGSLLGPYVVNRVDSLRLITAGLSLHYISFAALGICKNYYYALVIIFISHMIFYITLVGMHAVRDRITDFDIRSSAYGTTTAVLTPAAIVSMLAGSYFSNRFGVAAILTIAGLLALLSLFIILYLGRNIEVSFKTSTIKNFTKSA